MSDPYRDDMMATETTLRLQRGLSPRVLDESLMAMAQGWAERMARTMNLSHANMAGRAASNGWRGTALAENVAMGSSTAEATYAQWMGSPGHRANILDRDMNVAGFGHAVASNGEHYWSANYGTRTDAPPIDDIPPTSTNPPKRKGWLARLLGLFGIAWCLLAVIVFGQDAKTLDDAQRSPKWPAVRAAWLKTHGECAACGTTRKAILSVHHVVPFHIDRSKELDPQNLITLCEGEAVNCHLLFGHLMNWQSWNVNVREDAAAWRAKIKARPTLKKAKVAA